MKQVNNKKAFSMLTAIVIIVLMSSVAVFVMNISGKIVKSTTAQYQNEQAELYAKSYTEYAILAVTGNDRATKCLSTINGTIGTPSSGNGYVIQTEIAYIGPSSVIGNCAGTRKLSTNVTSVETPLTVVIDVYVKYRDPDNTAQRRIVHRRSIQKI